MPRKSGSSGESLELLLDTICNTFGGVLFLAMLVSLLLSQKQRTVEQSPADPRAAMSEADFVRLRTRADDASRAVESLTEQARSARRAALDLAVPDSEVLVAAMEAAETEVEQAAARRAQLLLEIAGEQAAAARASRAAVADDRERQELVAAAERTRKRLEMVLAERSELLESAVRIRDDLARRATVETTGKAPRMRKTDKVECGVLLRYGRLYRMKDLQGDGLTTNDRDFAVTPGLVANTARAKPHAGVDVGTIEGRESAFRRVLADFPSSRWYVCLVVYPDSFEEFLIVKNWLVEHGYEYRIMPTADSVVDQGASETFVQ